MYRHISLAIMSFMGYESTNEFVLFGIFLDMEKLSSYQNPHL